MSRQCLDDRGCINYDIGTRKCRRDGASCLDFPPYWLVALGTGDMIVPVWQCESSWEFLGREVLAI